MKSRDRNTIAVITLLLLFSLCGGAGISSAAPFTTENVIILVIDGLRNEEAFDDPLHLNIPHMWNDLRPQGTIYTQCYTSGWPVTTTGHLAMITGVRSNIPLSVGSISGNAREHRPTIFELYRKYFDLPRSETWIISGKNQLSTCDYSLHPLWGENYGASLAFGVGRSDVETMQRFYQVAAQDHPSLALINLRRVDYEGHWGTFQEYLDAIMVADSLVLDLWQNIQANPIYQDKTLLIATTDHGRSPRDISIHGGPDHSNRHVFFLALGPDVMQGAEFSTDCLLIDIASTVAYVLGFDTPYSEGRVLTEMFESPVPMRPTVEKPRSRQGMTRLTDSAGASTFPSILADSTGVYIVWSEQETGGITDSHNIMYIESTNQGDSWSEPDTILADFHYYRNHFPSDVTGAFGLWDGDGYIAGNSFKLFVGGTPITADLENDADGGLVVMVNGYATFSFPGKKEIRWGVNQIKRDTRSNWSEQGFENLGKLVANTPGLATGESGVWTTWTDGGGQISLGRVVEGKEINDRELILPDYREYGYFYRTPQLAAGDGRLHLVFDLHSKDSGFISYLRFAESDLHMERWEILDSGPGPSTDPRITNYGGVISVVWADHEAGVWQIKYRRSTDGGDNFSTPQQISTSTAGGWHPDIAASGDSAVIVWEDYRDGEGQIYWAVSTDAGDTWGDEMQLALTPSFSAYPRITGYDNTFYTVWQDYQDGNWEIYFSDLPAGVE